MSLLDVYPTLADLCGLPVGEHLADQLAVGGQHEPFIGHLGGDLGPALDALVAQVAHDLGQQLGHADGPRLELERARVRERPAHGLLQPLHAPDQILEDLLFSGIALFLRIMAFPQRGERKPLHHGGPGRLLFRLVEQGPHQHDEEADYQ